MNVALIMPTMRWQNWPAVFAHIAAAQCDDCHFFWLPVLYPREMAAANTAALNHLYSFNAPRWVRPLMIAEEPGVNHCLRKQNAALDVLEAEGFDGWVCGVSDDNLLPRNLGRWLAAVECRRQKAECRMQKTGVIVFSHKRGQHVPAEDPAQRYGTSDLIAAPDNMRVGCVSGEQYFVHMDLMRGRRWPHHPCADGILIEQLHNEFPGDFCFVPDYFIPFNALEPGRWDETELKKVIEAD